MDDEEGDNIFFVLAIEEEPMENEAAAELSLVVDVKGNEKSDSMEYLYSLFYGTEDLEDMKKWIDKAIAYLNYVEEHGVPIPLTLGVEDDEPNVEG